MLITVSLGFAPSEMLDQALENYYKTAELKTRHIFLDNHYPINKSKNKEEYKRICNKYGMEYHDAGKNLGLHEGFNHALTKSGFSRGDIFIAFDADSYPINPGWDRALVDTLGEQDIVWASMQTSNSPHETVGKSFEERIVKGRRVWIVPSPITNGCSAFRGDFIFDAGGVSEYSDWYGYLENAMFDRLGDKKWGFLPDYFESTKLTLLHDKEYTAYKWALAHARTTTLDFESWLNQIDGG